MHGSALRAGDYANPDGSIDGYEDGIFKRYIGGWVETCESIELSITVDFDKDTPPNRKVLPRFDELREDEREKRNARRAGSLFMPYEDKDDFENACDDEVDWGEASGWNDLYGDDVEPSDIIEFRD